MQRVTPVRSFAGAGLPVMDDIGQQVINGLPGRGCTVRRQVFRQVDRLKQAGVRGAGSNPGAGGSFIYGESESARWKP